MPDTSAPKKRCPYPGLRPFRSDEADLFFGRDKQINDLLARLGKSRFLAVVGESGCGKSSLIIAGMIPALEAGLLDTDGADWQVTRMRPGSRPMRSLAEALRKSSAITHGPLRSSEDRALIEAELRRGPLGLLDVLREGGGLVDARLLLLVDQFEEIFRFRRDDSGEKPADSKVVDRDEAAAFVALLLRTIQAPEGRVYVVLTMRSDFLGDCARFTGLPETLNDSQFLTPRLTFDQRKSAIEGPARVEGGRVEPELTTALLNDMGPGPDQLPLMQHALMRAWTEASLRRPDSPIVERVDYLKVGGLKEAISRQADLAYDGLRPEQKPIAERLFRALTGGTVGKRDTRRPTKLGEIAAIARVEPEVVIAVVEHFRGGELNFLTSSTDTLDSESVLDLSHESLIRQWVRLKEWAKAEAKSAEKYLLLARTAAEKKQPWVDNDLKDILKWRDDERPNAAWAARYGGNYAEAMAFIEAGLERQEKVESEVESIRLNEQRTHFYKGIAGLAIIAVLVSSIFALWALYEKGKSEQSKSLAELKTDEAEKSKAAANRSVELAMKSADKARKQLDLSNSLILASEARNVSGSPVLSILLGSEAIQLRRKKSEPLNVEAENVLRQSLGKIGGAGMNPMENDVSCLAFSSDGKTLAVVRSLDFDRGSGVVLWDVGTRKRLVGEPLSVPEGNVFSVAFSPDNKLIAAGYGVVAENARDANGGGLVLWDAATRRRLPEMPLAQRGERVLCVAFSPDGRSIIAGTGSFSSTGNLGSVIRWDDIANPKRQWSKPLDDRQGAVRSIAFSPDGNMFAAGDSRHLVLCDAATLKSLTGESLDVNYPIISLAFSPDATTIAAGCSDLYGDKHGEVITWNVANRKRQESDPFLSRTGKHPTVTYSSDGKFVAAGPADFVAGGVAIVRVSPKGIQREILATNGPVSHVALSPNGKTIVAAETGGMRLWELTDDLSSSVEPRTLNEPSNLPVNFETSPDGGWIVEARAKMARAWKFPTPDSGKVEAIDLAIDALAIPPKTASDPPDVLFDPSGLKLAIVARHDLAVWNCTRTFLPKKSSLVLHASAENKLEGTVLSRGGRWLATRTGTNGLQVRIYDLYKLEINYDQPYCTVNLAPPAKAEYIKSDDKPSENRKQESSGSSALFGPEPKGSGLSTRTGLKRTPPECETAFSRDGRWLATCNRNQEIILRGLTADRRSVAPKVIRSSGNVSAVTFHPNNRFLLAATIVFGKGYTLKVECWKIGGEGGEPLTDPIHAKGLSISSSGSMTGDAWLAFSPDGEFFTFGMDMSFQLSRWTDTGFGTPYAPVAPGPNPSELTLTFSPDSRWFFTSGNNVSSALYTLNGNQDRPSFHLSPTSFGPLADFSRDSRFLATTASNDSAIVIDIPQWTSKRESGVAPPLPRSLPGLSPPVRLLRFGPDSRQLVTVGVDSLIRVWQLDTDKLLEAAERVAGRNLTHAEWNQYLPYLEYHKTFDNLPEPPVETDQRTGPSTL